MSRGQKLIGILVFFWTLQGFQFSHLANENGHETPENQKAKIVAQGCALCEGLAALGSASSPENIFIKVYLIQESPVSAKAALFTPRNDLFEFYSRGPPATL